MQLLIREDFSRAERALMAVARDQMPFAIAMALNDTARDCQRQVTAKLPEIFDRPTPTTMRSVIIKPARKDNPIAVVTIKDFIGKGIAPAAYLRAEELGGIRRDKRSERSLMATGIMQPGQSLEPGDKAPLDQYGNISGALMVRIISQVRGFAEQGYRANATERTRQRLLKQGKVLHARRQMQFFVARNHASGGNLGIYEVVSKGHVEQVLHFGERKASYAPRFHFLDQVGRVARATFPAHLMTRLREAIATRL